MWLPGRWFTIKCSSNLLCPIESWDLKTGGEIPEACCYTDIRLNGLHFHIYIYMICIKLGPQIEQAEFLV